MLLISGISPEIQCLRAGTVQKGSIYHQQEMAGMTPERGIP